MNKALSILIIFLVWLQPLSAENIEREKHQIVNAIETNRYYNHSYWDDDHGGSDWAYNTLLIIEYDLVMDTGLVYHLTIFKEDKGTKWKGYTPEALPYESFQIYWTYKNFHIQSNDVLYKNFYWYVYRDGKAVPFYRVLYGFEANLALSN